MNLDCLTLMVAGSFVAGVSALVLFGAWTQIRGPALLWWAAASLVNSVAIALIAFGIAFGDRAILVAGIGISTLSPALIWGGVRRFRHKRPSVAQLGAGTALWLVAWLIPFQGDPRSPITIAAFAVWVAYLTAANADLWRSRDVDFMARWPLIALFSLHAVVFAGGIADAISGNMPSGTLSPFSNWFSWIHFETLIYSIGTAVFMVLMCKERSERGHIIAARHDSLTGIANRGAFLESAERVLQRCRSDATSMSLIMFDLDRFKVINDTHGHATGDIVIRQFADTTRALLRPNDLFGRYGGEEFAVILPGATIEAAYVVADRIRHHFAQACSIVDDKPMNATVSAGVATAWSDATIDTIMRIADRNLYRAKDLGRNRVERTVGAPANDDDAVVRIA